MNLPEGHWTPMAWCYSSVTRMPNFKFSLLQYIRFGNSFASRSSNPEGRQARAIARPSWLLYFTHILLPSYLHSSLFAFFLWFFVSFILAVPMGKCSRQHLYIRFILPTAIPNGTCFFLNKSVLTLAEALPVKNNNNNSNTSNIYKWIQGFTLLTLDTCFSALWLLCTHQCLLKIFILWPPCYLRKVQQPFFQYYFKKNKTLWPPQKWWQPQYGPWPTVSEPLLETMGHSPNTYHSLLYLCW